MSEEKRVVELANRLLDTTTANRVYKYAVRKGFLNEYLSTFFAGEGYSALDLEAGLRKNSESAEKMWEGKVELIIRMRLKEGDVKRFKEDINNSLGDKLYEHLRNTPEKWI